MVQSEIGGATWCGRYAERGLGKANSYWLKILHYLEKDDLAANIRLCAKLTLEPGVSIGTHDHQQEDEIFIIAKGKAMTDDGTSRTELIVGDVTVTGKGGVHSIENIGDTDLEVIAIIACYDPK